MPTRILSFLTPPILVAATAAISFVVVASVYLLSLQKPSGSYETARMGSISEEVDSTGSIKAADSLALSFEAPGRIASVPVRVGQHVSAGAILASLNGAELAANLSQARAALAAQEAKLEGLKAGARPEDLAVSQTSVNGAESGVSQAKQTLLSAAQDAYVKADDAIHNKVDLFLDNPRSAQPHLALSFSDQSLQNAVVNGRVQMETLLKDWQAYLQSQNGSDVSTLVATSRTNIQAVSAYLDTVSAGLSTAISSAYVTSATLQGYQSAVATARSNVSASQSALNAAATAQQSADSALASAKSQYTLKQAGASAQDIAAQEAAVSAAAASVDLAMAQLGKTVIRAPITGTIAKTDARLGEIAAPGTPLITLDSDSNFQIESYVSEAAVPNVHAGEKADVRIDAYKDSDPLQATVVVVDPAATMQNGVATYKVTLQFDIADPRIKAGLTTNVRMHAQSQDSVLLVPTSSVVTRGNDHYVLKSSGGVDELTKVQVGIQNQGGDTEIVSGLAAGDKIRSFGDQ